MFCTQFGNSGLTENVSVVVQQIAQADFTNARWQPATHQLVEKIGCAGAFYFKAIKAGHFHHTDMLAQRRHFFCHQVPGFGKAKTVLINEIGLVFRLKTQHPLPAINNAPDSAKLVEHRIQRCSSSQPGRRSMLMRHVIVKLVLIVFNGFQTSVFGIGVAGKAAWVETPGIPLTLTVHHQFCQYFPMATAFANTRAQTDNTVGVLQPRYLPDQR